MEDSRNMKLLIIEPWDAYDEINIELIQKKYNKFLFKIANSIFFKGNKIDFLIGIMRDNNQYDKFIEGKSGKYLFNLIYDELINIDALNNLDNIKFKGNFLMGEIDL